MANLKKEVTQIQRKFHSMVLASGGRIEKFKKSGSERYDYILDDVKQYFIWHYTISDMNGVKMMLRDLRRVAVTLNIGREVRKAYEIELIVRVHYDDAWEAFEDWTETWLKNITAKIEAETKEAQK